MFPSPRDEAPLAEIGITLRNGRVQRGLTIDQVAQETRISPRFLEALEAEAFEELPAPVYVRGFLRSYANFLHLDATPLLEQLSVAGGAPIGGPDGFVRGPRTTAQSRKPSTNPFRPAAPAARPQTQQRAAPPEPMMPVAAAPAAFEEEIDEGWAPERLPGAFEEDEPAMIGRSYPANPQLDDFQPEPAYGEPEPSYRARRTSGMLLERDAAESGGGSNRTLAIAAGGVVVLLFFLAVGVLLTRGGGGSNAAAPGGQTATATSKAGTVISALGTQTGVAGTPTAGGSATANASPSTAASASPNASVTASAPTSTNGNGTTTTPSTATATPTTGPTQAPTVAPTPLPPTPIPPTPSPVPSHPSQYSLCGGVSNCGDSPFTVVCPPDNLWYVDPSGGANNPHGWPTHTVIRLGDASCP